MEWLQLEDVFLIHASIIARSGGSNGIRNPAALESALAQPLQPFGGNDLYPSFLDKAAALCFFLVRNHPFVDGNKRVGHASLEISLQLNGLEIMAEQEDQETIMLALAQGELTLESFTEWVKSVAVPLNASATEQ